MAISRPIYGPGQEDTSPLRPASDLAGTPVSDREGRYVGEVYGVLADAKSGLIRYLDLALEGNDKHVLVPLGHTRLTRLIGKTEVELRAARREELESIPELPSGSEPDDDFEERLLAAHGRIFHGERYYAHPAYDHRGLYAGEHPIIEGPSLHPRGAGPLERLSAIPEYEISRGEPDIRGWPLIDAEDRVAGEIEDLIIDPEAGKVRYALVEGGEGPIPIPVGYLEVDLSEEVVRSPGLESTDLEVVPAYEEASFDREAEVRIMEALSERLSGRRRFSRPDFNGAHQIGKESSE